MILGIGIDSIEIDRFIQWQTYAHKKLTRVLSKEEIEYCLNSPCKSAERFAARFATREAFFKAFTAMQPNHFTPFLTVCKNVIVTKQKRNPLLQINWDKLGYQSVQNELLTAHLSLTHTQTTATAWVIIEKS